MKNSSSYFGSSIGIPRILHPSDQLDKLARRHLELRKAHSDAINGLHAVSKELSRKYGEHQSSCDSLVKQVGEGPANEINADRKRAHEFVVIHPPLRIRTHIFAC